MIAFPVDSPRYKTRTMTHARFALLRIEIHRNANVVLRLPTLDAQGSNVRTRPTITRPRSVRPPCHHAYTKWISPVRWAQPERTSTNSSQAAERSPPTWRRNSPRCSMWHRSGEDCFGEGVSGPKVVEKASNLPCDASGRPHPLRWRSATSKNVRNCSRKCRVRAMLSRISQDIGIPGITEQTL
jgi:hypothetical protein